MGHSENGTHRKSRMIEQIDIIKEVEVLKDEVLANIPGPVSTTIFGDNPEMMFPKMMLINPEDTITCKYCGELISTVQLRGFSVICPICGKPQNEESYLTI